MILRNIHILLNPYGKMLFDFIYRCPILHRLKTYCAISSPSKLRLKCLVCRLLQQMQPILIQRGNFRGATGNINIQRYYADARSRAATQEVERYLPKCRPIPRITRNRISRCSTLFTLMTYLSAILPTGNTLAFQL